MAATRRIRCRDNRNRASIVCESVLAVVTVIEAVKVMETPSVWGRCIGGHFTVQQVGFLSAQP